MAEWFTAKLTPIPELQDTLSDVGTAAGLLRTGLNAQKLVVRTVGQLLPDAAEVPNVAVKLLVNLILGGVLGALETGAYGVVLYPTNIDYSTAAMDERIYKLEQEADALLARSQQPTGGAPRTTFDGYFLKYQEKLAEAQKWKRERMYVPPSFLTTQFGIGELLAQLSETVDDEFDDARPRFNVSNVCTGVVMTVGSDSLLDLSRLASTLATWLQTPHLARLSNTLSEVVARTNVAPTPFKTPGAGAAPDWKRASIANLVGLEPVTAALRKVGNAFQPNVYSGNATAARIAAAIDAALAGITDAMSATDAALDVLTALSALSSEVGFLFVPPVDGEIEVVPGLMLPNITQGIGGFIQKVNESQNRPTHRWMIGVVILAGFPGLAQIPMTSALYNSAGVQSAITSATKVYSALRALGG